jgi:hypothetical protein
MGTLSKWQPVTSKVNNTRQHTQTQRDNAYNGTIHLEIFSYQMSNYRRCASIFYGCGLEELSRTDDKQGHTLSAAGNTL